MPQRVAFVGRDMIGLVAFDFVLRVFCRGVMRVPFVIEVFGVNGDDGSADSAGFGIPADVIAYLECLGHGACTLLAYSLKYQTGRQATIPARACKAKTIKADFGLRASHLKAKNAITGICSAISN